MAINSRGIFDAVKSHAIATGLFQRVNGHEPKNAPGSGLSLAIWIEALTPYPGRSGLAATAVVVTLNVRIYSNMLQKPEDDIDPNMLDACDLLFAAYSGDFQLGDVNREIDLLGESGQNLNAKSGYVTIDTKLFRVMVITLPIIVNDVWSQVP